jgi:hypothetical protein
MSEFAHLRPEELPPEKGRPLERRSDTGTVHGREFVE